MENYQMGRSTGRPYRTTCGMNRMPSNERMLQGERTCQNMRMPREKRMSERACDSSFSNINGDCSCRMPGTISNEAEMYAHLKHLPPAMAYVPCQSFSDTFELRRALQAGTIFPELCRPFCGKRGFRK